MSSGFFFYPFLSLIKQICLYHVGELPAVRAAGQIQKSLSWCSTGGRVAPPVGCEQWSPSVCSLAAAVEEVGRPAPLGVARAAGSWVLQQAPATLWSGPEVL